MIGRVKHALVGLLALSACGGDPPPPLPAARSNEVFPAEPGVLRLAGSGTMVPLAHALGDAFHAAHPGSLRIVVEDSIGSGGGLRAAVDGAIDVALVSRALSAKEIAWPLQVLPLAHDAVVLATHPDVSIPGVTSDEVLALYSGRSHSFADGTPAVVLLRDPGESANIALDATIPGMKEARDRGLRLGFRVLYHEDAMAAALAVTPGAIGVYSLGLMHSTRIPVKVLALDGRRPSVAGIQNGSWPMTRPLALATRTDRAGRAAEFFAFAVSPEAARIIEAGGYLPLPPTPAGATPRQPIPASDFAAFVPLQPSR